VKDFGKLRELVSSGNYKAARWYSRGCSVCENYLDSHGIPDLLGEYYVGSSDNGDGKSAAYGMGGGWGAGSGLGIGESPSGLS
jgi:hypothetical protein